MSEMRMVANVGDVVAGRYRIQGVLGTGGMGAVFDAAQAGLNRRVALKLMHPEVGLDPDARARFEREARVSAALHHPGAVKIFDYGEDAGRLFIVMERLEGTPLRTFVNDDLPVMPLPRTLDIARQVAEVLIVAHDMQLVHRDLKPENIFLEKKPDGTDRAVVVDFGLAFIDQREDAARMTQAGMLVGTPAYISPEQVGGLPVGPPADMYSFGCMLYEMVTAVPPFDGNALMMLPKHLFEAPVPPSRRRSDTYIPRALEELILRLLAKQAPDRPHARAVSEALGQLALTLGDRERARGREALEGRAARMIPTVRGPMDVVPMDGAQPAPRAPVVAEGGIAVALVGSMSDSVALGLRANGYTVAPVVDHLPPEAEAIYFATTDRAWIESAVQTGLPVLVEMNVDDVSGVSAMMAMGVADVVPHPVRVEQAATKLARALRRSRRRRSS